MWAARVIAAIVIAIASTCAAAVADDQMPWLPSLEAAQQVAARTNRLVLIHFWAPWCQPCMRLEREVFSKPETGKALEANFVMVKLNTDEAPGTARLYGVSSLPSDVIISPNGRLVSQLQSPPTANQYVVQMNQAAAGYRQLTARPTQHAAVTPVSANPAIAQPVVAMPQPAPVIPPAAPPVAGAPGQPAMAPQVVAMNAPQSPGVSPEQLASQAPPTAAVASAPPMAAAQGAQAPVAAPAVDRYAEYFPPGTSPQTVAPQTRAPQAAAAQMGAPQPAPGTQAATASVGTSVPNAAAAPLQGAYNSYVSYQQQQQPPAPQLPAGCPPLGLDGNCPVTLVERMQWSLGDRAWGAVHRGRTYLFAGPEERARFLASPDLYSPVMSGIDPVLALDNQMVVAGKREFGVFGADRRIYLFADEASLKRFEQNPKRYAAEAIQAQR
ncbi:MAG TPA: thioredoxin family protein [Pirellulales bacterium]